MRWLVSFERGALLNWHHTFKPAGYMPVPTPALRGKPQPKQKAEERAFVQFWFSWLGETLLGQYRKLAKGFLHSKA